MRFLDLDIFIFMSKEMRFKICFSLNIFLYLGNRTDTEVGMDTEGVSRKSNKKINCNCSGNKGCFPYK